MATGYTQTELDWLLHAMDEAVPSMPRRADRMLSESVVALRSAGTDKGVLFIFEYKEKWTETFWLNVWVAKELAAACNLASHEFGWAKRGLSPEPSDHLREPKIDDIDDAANVVSLSTNAATAGILVRFAVEPPIKRRTLHFPARAALTVLSTIAAGALTAAWWDPDTFELIPCRDSQH